MLADFVTDDLDSKEHLDNVFFIILTYAAFDAGPMILIVIDWWYYYSGSKNGLLGRKTNPMRCVVGQSAVLFVVSWSFIAVFEEYADDAAEWIWPWIMHGIISTAALVFCAMIHFNDIVTGNKIANPSFLTISKILAVAMGVAVFAVGIFMIESLVDGSNEIPAFFLVLYLYYYTALSVPSVAAMASFKAQEAAVEQNVMMVEVQAPPTAAFTA